jgi:Spy/CpxP family protein refolding chaperone
LVRIGASSACALFLSAAALRVPAFGEEKRGSDKKWEEKREERGKKMAKELGLSADQEKQLKDSRKAHREKGEELRKEMQGKREAMKAELEKPSLDMSRINSLQAEIKDLQGKMDDNRLDGILQVRKILTADQFKKFDEMIAKRFGKGGERGDREWKGRDHGEGPGDEGPGEDRGPHEGAGHGNK